MNINEPSSVIAPYLSRWARNRDVISGPYTVKAKGEKYLPKAFGKQKTEEYQSYLNHVSFYPAASRTCDGITGLMMRRDPVLENKGVLMQIKHVITSNGDSLEQLTRLVCRETLITNFTGLLTDYPAGQATSAGAAIYEGIRPFVNLYPAESILECTPGIVRNQRVPVRVRLLDDGNTVRELILEDGFVVVNIYRAENGHFPEKPTERYEPRANGQRLTEIPFDLITINNTYSPEPAPLEPVVALNLDHYVTEGLLTVNQLYTTTPMLVATGVNSGESDTIEFSPGAVMVLENPEAKVYVVTTPSDASGSLENKLSTLEDRMAAVASRILARQKSVAEAAEVEALRQGAENSVLAMIANSISAKMERALKRVSDFTDGSDVRFQINTDYLPANISPQEITALLGLRSAGEMSAKSFFYKLRDAGIFDETLTFEEEQKRRAETPAPTTQSGVQLTELKPLSE